MSVHRQWAERAVTAGILILVGSVALRAVGPSASPGRQTAIRTGTETVLVFIAATTCSGIERPELLRAINTIRERLDGEAERAGSRLVTLGVSLDWHLPDGAKLLERFGPFDAILVGRGWMNTGAVLYIWREFPGRAGIPQVLVFERSVKKGDAIEVTDERMLYRFVGAARIEAWASSMGPTDIPDAALRPGEGS